MFGREYVEEQAIQWAAVDIVTPPLPADVAEMEPLQDALRRDVGLDGPRVYCLEPQFFECQRQQRRAGRQRRAPVSFVAEHGPDRSSLEVPVDVGEADHPCRHVRVVRGIDAELVK